MRADSLAVVVRRRTRFSTLGVGSRWLERRGPRAGEISPQLAWRASAVGKFCRVGRQEVSYV